MFIISFLSFSVVTSTQMINEAPTLFPVIDICNLNSYDGMYAGDSMRKVLEESNITREMYREVKNYVETASDVFKSHFITNFDTNTLYYYGFYLSQMLISCRYQGIECGLNDFYYFHNYHYGSCYRFNGGKGGDFYEGLNATEFKKSKKSGWKNGLQLELNVGNLSKQQYTYKAGIRVIVHNISVEPFADEDGIDVSTGQQTNIAISRYFINRLSSPYSDCIDNLKSPKVYGKNEILRKMYEYFNISEYNQKYCLKLCYQNYLIQKCKCYDLSLMNPNTNLNGTNSTVNGCIQVEDIDCQKKLKLNFLMVMKLLIVILNVRLNAMRLFMIIKLAWRIIPLNGMRHCSKTIVLFS